MLDSKPALCHISYDFGVEFWNCPDSGIFYFSIYYTYAESETSSMLHIFCS